MITLELVAHPLHEGSVSDPPATRQGGFAIAPSLHERPVPLPGNTNAPDLSEAPAITAALTGQMMMRAQHESNGALEAPCLIPPLELPVK